MTQNKCSARTAEQADPRSICIFQGCAPSVLRTCHACAPVHEGACIEFIHLFVQVQAAPQRRGGRGGRRRDSVMRRPRPGEGQRVAGVRRIERVSAQHGAWNCTAQRSSTHGPTDTGACAAGCALHVGRGAHPDSRTSKPSLTWSRMSSGVVTPQTNNGLCAGRSSWAVSTMSRHSPSVSPRPRPAM